MFCSKCGDKNSDTSKFCQKCGHPLAPNNPLAASAPQGGSVPSNFTPGRGYIPPTAGNPMQSGRVAPNAAPPPPNGGYPPQNSGYRPPNPGFGPNTGYIRPNPGFGVNNGYNQPPQGYPPKKKNTGLIAAIIVLILVVIAVPIIIVASNNMSRNDNNGYSTNNAVLADNSSNPFVAPTPDSSSETSAQSSAPSDGGQTADGFRNNYTQILGDGKDTVTVMVYICGADLESDNGCATLDISEMLAANLGSNVNVILETGGCTTWSTPGIKDGEVQRWAIKDGELQELQELGQKSMLNSSELGDFISYAAANYPANRFELVLWDHGGGSFRGYGSDQIYPDSVLYLPDIAKALTNSGVKFDFIGFDACLMGSLETAYMLEPYADYLIGSEETEPAFGWNYTPWLSTVGENTSIDTVELGKSVVDSFMSANVPTGDEKGADNTLSVVALREIPHVYDALCDYMANATEALANKEFKIISTAVSHTKAFAEGNDLDMIDIEDFANKADLTGKNDLDTALNSAVKYSQSTARSGVFGLSFYLPYRDLSVYGDAKEEFSEFGFSGDVYKFYDKFVNILAGGQTDSTSRSLKENLTGQQDAATDYSAYGWYDNSQVQNNTSDNINYTELEILQDEATGNWYLPLTTDDWSLLTDVQMQILLDDGAGYIDLGSDQYYETDDNGNLLLNYGNDNSWIAIGGQIVCYYAESTTQMDDGSMTFTGYVPAQLNDKTDIDIMLEWDGENTDGYIVGYRLSETSSANNAAGPLGKGYKQFKAGDKIDFLCDYYTYDGAYDSSYLFGDSMTIGDTLPAVTYEDVGTGTVLECYMLVDIYQNESWTQTVEFSADTEG